MGNEEPDKGLLIDRCSQRDLDALAKHEPPGAGIAERMLQLQEEGQVLFVAAWDQGVPIGTAVLDFNSNYAPELKNLFVDPSRRGEGVGTALCAWIESAAQEAGYARIYLGVGTDNDRARDLYNRIGYQPIGESKTVSYEYLDDAGVTRTATETSGYYQKSLPT